MRKLELKEITTFTEAVAGKLAGKKFKLISKCEGLNIPFKWIWPIYNCENCGHHKQETVLHYIETVGIYALQEPVQGEEPMTVWIGFTHDGRIMSIPKTRRAELMPHLPSTQVENGIS